LTNLPITPGGQDDGARMENVEEILDSDNASDNSQGVEAVENLKVNDQSGNVVENKGSASDKRERSGNIIENKYSYAQNARILLKTKGVDGMS
jgi:hypothetical protein